MYYIYVRIALNNNYKHNYDDLVTYDYHYNYSGSHYKRYRAFTDRRG